MAIGQLIRGKERIIVSIAERVGRQLLPIACVIAGLMIVVYFHFVKGTTVGKVAYGYLMIGVIAAFIQLLSAILFSPRNSKIIVAVGDFIVITASLVFIRCWYDVLVLLDVP